MVKKRKEEVVEEKEKRKILITKKKLIKLVNSPAAAPKTWFSKTASVRFCRSSKKRVSFQQGVVQFD